LHAEEQPLGLDSQDPFFSHGEAQRYSIPGASLVVSVDYHLPDPSIAHFGYFECLDGVDPAALFAAASAWARARGKSTLHGPVNLSVLRGYRMQTAGFDRPEHPGEPRFPRYYPHLLAGFTEVATWSSWDIPRHKLLLWRAIQQFQASKVRALRAQGYRVRAIDVTRLDEELRLLHPLVMESFAGNYGFAPVSVEEYVYVERHLRDTPGGRAYFLLDPAERLVGFTFGLRDRACAVLHTFAIAKAERGKGLAYFLFAHAMEVMKKDRVRFAIGALVKQGPSHYSRIGRPSRRYAVFARPT
jgi:GNAT superfamily N-acetyltransferase